MTALAPPDTENQEGASLGLVGAIVVLSGVLVVLDVTIANVALAPIAADLGADLPTIQWVSSAYALALAVVIPSARFAMDRFGTRAVFVASLSVFTAASVLATIAPTAETLIASRVLMGLGGGLLTPTGMVMIMRAAGPARRGVATRIVGVPIFIAPLLGPVLGGLLVDAISWRALFAMNIPVGIVPLLLAVLLLPRDRPADASTQRLDLPALLMLAPGVALLVYTLSAGAQQGLDGSTLLVVGVGIALIAGFVIRSRTSPHPLVDLSLARSRAVGPALAAGALFASGYFGSMFVAPLYFQVIRDTSVSVSGLLILPLALSTAVSMQIAGWAIDRVGAVRVVRTGIVVALVGLGAFVVQLTPDASYGGLCVALGVTGLGIGATLMPAFTAASSGVDSQGLPSVTTMFQVTNQVAAAIGTAVVAVTLSAALAASLPGTPANEGLAATQALPAEILGSAAGITDGFRVAYLVVLGLFAAALLVSLAMRAWEPVRPEQEPERVPTG